MATIECTGHVSPAEFMAEVAKMSDALLIAQDVMQQGAVHAISYLLSHGCTEEIAADMLASLRENAELIRAEARRRGKPALFDRDQTAFS